MGKRIIDVLAPYEDEVLVSWIVRMLRMYKGIKLDSYTYEVMRDLFGPTSTAKPGLYLQNGLQYFCDNCGISNSTVFGSEEMMYERLSVIPFYLCFCSDEQKELIKNRISNTSYYLYLENIIGIRNGHSYIEGQAYYKFCPECMKLQKEHYLKREHQVQGNLVCWEHRCILHRVPYSLNWKDIDFPANINDDSNVTTYELTELNYSKAISIAEMVHEIFLNGFKENIDILKDKIMHRLKALKIVSDEGKFYNLESFIEELDIGYLYQYVPVEKELISAVFVTPRTSNPIIYLALIQYLFGSLESYYTYDYESGASVKLQYKNVQQEMVEDRIHDISFYISNQPKWFAQEYVILGETRKEIIIKHFKCGNILRRSKKLRKFSKCRYCEGNPTEGDYKRENEISQNELIYYVSTSDYGKIHGKKPNQISNYCKANRFPDAIMIGDKYLIPMDAPYPEDRRFKKNTKEIRGEK